MALRAAFLDNVLYPVDLYRAASGRSTVDAMATQILFLNSNVSYAAFFTIIYDAHPRWMPVFSLFYGTAYFLASQLVRDAATGTPLCVYALHHDGDYPNDCRHIATTIKVDDYCVVG